MRKLLVLFSFLVILSNNVSAQNTSSFWQSTSNNVLSSTSIIKARTFKEYDLNYVAIKNFLSNLPSTPNAAQLIQLPMPNGNFRTFKVWQYEMMEAPLAAKYPQIKTFTAVATDDKAVTAKIDYTGFGFHAMVFDGDNTYLIDPYNRQTTTHYIVRYKKDEYRDAYQMMSCGITDNNIFPSNSLLNINKKLPANSTPTPAQKIQNGHQLRTYRTAISADNQYCTAVGAANNHALALAAITTTINRVNGVYEREFTARMILIANEDTLIWAAVNDPTNGADPFNAINGNANSCLNTNQTTCDTRIGTANYDYGHVFTTGAGGLSTVGIVCTNGQKARTVTGSTTPTGDGFDIDYVAHEVGHAWGCSHTFNDNTNGSCGGNRSATHAYEPGSGTTIMAYAGICNPDNIQTHSNDYFHRTSLEQEYSYMVTGGGNACAAFIATGNTYNEMAAFNATYSVPYLTPFELISPVIQDTSADTAYRYCWEEWDLGAAFDYSTGTPNATQGPSFHSFQPDTSRTRVFPAISYVLAGTTAYNGEKLPNTARTLAFRMSARSFWNGLGTLLLPDDSIHLDVINTGAAFTVTAPATAASWAANSTQTVTWNVVNTNIAPINAANVDIYLSIDGGNTWPTLIGTFPNTGTASITVPNVSTTNTARIKVKGSNNVFFNVNAGNFTITAATGTISAGGPTTFCAGGNVVLSANPSTGATYQWQFNGANIPGATTATYTAIISGNYACIINGSTSNVIAVTVNTNPTVNVTPAGPASFCVGSSLTLTATANNGAPFTYQWQLNGTPISGATSTTYAAITAGSYNVIVTNVNTCTATSNTIVLTTNPAPTANVTTPSGTSLCGFVSLPLVANAGGGYTYQWQLNGTNIVGATGGTYNATAPGSYTVIVTASGCSTTSSAVVVTATTPTPTITAPSGLSICAVSSLPLNASTGTGVTYQWQLNGSNIAGATASTYTATAVGSYTVVEIQGTCSAATSAPSVVTASAPTPTISASATVLCGGNTATLTTPSLSGYTYQWYLNGVAISGATGLSYTASSPGSYTVKVTGSASCIGTSAPTVLTAGNVPTAVIVPAGPVTFCQGGSVVLPANSDSGLTYQWFVNGNAIAGATQSFYIATQSGVYSVVITRPGCGSSTSFDVTVTVKPAPLPIITQNGTILSVPNIYNSYQWYMNGTAITGATQSSYTLTQNGAYSVSVTDTSLCTGSSATLNIGTSGIATVSNNGIKVFPNPTKSLLFIESVSNVSIDVKDITGRTLITETSKVVDMSNLVSGMYIIYIKDTGNVVQIEKVVKE